MTTTANTTMPAPATRAGHDEPARRLVVALAIRGAMFSQGLAYASRGSSASSLTSLSASSAAGAESATMPQPA
jgi:hypothetical protein